MARGSTRLPLLLLPATSAKGMSPLVRIDESGPRGPDDDVTLGRADG